MCPSQQISNIYYQYISATTLNIMLLEQNIWCNATVFGSPQYHSIWQDAQLDVSLTSFGR